MEKYKDAGYSNLERALDLLSCMTLKEKVGQLNQRLYGFSVYERKGREISFTEDFKDEVENFSGLGVLYGLFRADPWSRKDYTNGLEGSLAVETYNRLQKYVIENSRLGIPVLISSECPHGHQALDGYLLPVNLASAATFNPPLLKRAGEVCGRQLKAMGVHLALVSMLDILRDPRWGRSEETFGEDPYLASAFAEAIVSGIQESEIYVVAKHFAAQGEGTGGINASAARIGERELREIHLPPVKAACRAGVKGIMAAYNEIDGIPCHSNSWLLRKVLREELGFKGIVMADGTAIDILDALTGDNVKSGAKALKAGVDVSLWDTAFSQLSEAVDRGEVEEALIDEAVLRVLLLKFDLGLFESPYLEDKTSWTSFNYKSYGESQELARESVVLLKNKVDILPIEMKPKSIAVIGPNSDDLYNQLGDYTPPVRKEEGATVLQGIKEWLEKNQWPVKVTSHKGCYMYETDANEELIREAVKAAEGCDYIILVLGGTSSRFSGAAFEDNGAVIAGEGITMDCGEGVDSGTLELPGPQLKLLEELAALGTKLTTIIVAGRPYALEKVAELSDALLLSFYPGMQGGRVLGEIIFGEASPSGRLPVSIPRHPGQLPVYYNPKASYKAMDYYNIPSKALYTFGDGLSYTTFLYKNPLISKVSLTIEELEKEEIALTFTIKNTGNRGAHAVPQLYIQDVEASITRRVIELKSFTKVYLVPKEEKQVTLRLTSESLTIFNDNREYALEPGRFNWYLKDSGIEYARGIFTLLN